MSKVGTASGEYFGITDGMAERDGEWLGKGAEAVGLTGVITSEKWEAFIGQRKDPTHPDFADPDRGDEVPVWGNAPRGAAGKPQSIDERVQERVDAAGYAMTPEEVNAVRLQVAKEARTQPPLYNEFTFSAQKSISVLTFNARLQASQCRDSGDLQGAAMWESRRAGLQDAFDAGSKAALSFIEQHAGATRAGRHPGPNARWVEAPFVAAWFQQSTSQDGDPQIHAHMPIAPRTIDAEGEVRAVDTMGIRAAHRAAAEHGNRIMVEKIAAMGWGLKLTHGKQGIEIEGVTQVEMDSMSSRSKIIRPRVQKAVDAFRASEGRGPTAREMHKITQYATVTTRGKAVKENEAEFFARIVKKTNEEDLGMLDEMAARFRYDQLPSLPEAFNPTEVISEALFEVQTGKATWDKFDLYEKVAERMPAHLGSSDDSAIQELYWGMVESAVRSPEVRQIGGFDLAYEVPAMRLRSDGTSQYTRAKSEVFVTLGHMDAEGALLRAAATADRTKVEVEVAEAWIQANAARASASQAAALRAALTAGAVDMNLVGPAGTGKSWVLGKLAQAWPELTGGRVIGLATTERATKVLREEGIELSRNVSQFLIECQSNSEAKPRPGDFIVLDEASMTDTVDAEAVLNHVDSAGAQMASVGDPQQLGSVNAGGWFKTSVERGANTFTLDEVMRFDNEWEGPASLKLRQGDESAVHDYARHGRLVAAGTPADALKEAAERYVTQRLLGRVTIVTVATNADSAIVASHIRERFVQLGYTTDEHGTVQLGRDDNSAGVGDMVMARRNDSKYGVTNRDIYKLTAIKDDGSVELLDEATGQLVTLPAVYVQEDTQLGYASTAHAAEGVTVTGEAITVVTPQMGREALYVGLTRSKTSNVAIVSTVAVDERGRELEDQVPADVEAIIADRMQLERVELSAHDVLAMSDFDRTDAKRIQGRLEETSELIGEARLEVYLNELAKASVLSSDDRARFAEERSDTSRKMLVNHLRLAEQAGRDPQVVLTEAIGKADFGEAVNVNLVTTARITRPYEGNPPPPDPLIARQLPKDAPQDQARAWEQLMSLSDDRHRVLGGELAQDPPAWITARLGQVPGGPVERLEWEDKAGRIGYSREIDREEVTGRLLGRSPGVRSPEARVAWHEAHDAAGRPPQLRAETEMTEGQLRVRAKAAARVDRWAPDHVDGALEAAATAFYAAEKAQADAVAAGDEDAEVSSKVLAMELKLAQAEWGAAAKARDEYMQDSQATREAGRRAEAEMAERGITADEEDGMMTLDDYLDRDRERQELEDRRDLSDADMHEEPEEDPDYDQVVWTPAEPTVVQDQPQEREAESYTESVVPDELARARSTEAATVATAESAYLRAQSNAYEQAEVTRLANRAAESLPKRRTEVEAKAPAAEALAE